jgi:hypothetical protein
MGFPDSPVITSDPAINEFGVSIFGSDPSQPAASSDQSGFSTSDPYGGFGIYNPPAASSPTSTPAQSAQPGSSLLGWLGLGTAIASTTINAARTGAASSRPGVLTGKTTGSPVSAPQSTLIFGAIIAIFVVIVFALRK